MVRLRQSLLTMLNPSFHAFLLRRAAVSLHQTILSFHAERSVAGSSTARLARVGRGVTMLDGALLQTVQLERGDFAFEVPVASPGNGQDHAHVPAVLRDFHKVRLDAKTQAQSDAGEPQYGIASVILE